MAGTPIVSEFHDVVGTDISFAVSSRRPSMWKPTLANAVAHRANFRKAQLGLIGAILAAGKRTVTPALRVMGLGHHANFALCHHVLKRAVGRRSMSVASF